MDEPPGGHSGGRPVPLFRAVAACPLFERHLARRYWKRRSGLAKLHTRPRSILERQLSSRSSSELLLRIELACPTGERRVFGCGLGHRECRDRFRHRAPLCRRRGAWATESVETGSGIGRPYVDAGALHQLALTETSVGSVDLAVGDLQQGNAAQAKLPSNDQRFLRVVYAIELAEAQANLGEVERPLALLAGLQEEVQRCEAVLKLRFAAVLGLLYLRQDNYAESKSLLDRALKIGESSRAKLSEPDRLTWVRAMGDIYRTLVECEIKNGSEPRQSWELWSGYRAALFNQGSATNLAGDVVASGEAVLAFAELPSGVAAWLGTPRGFYFRRLDPETKVVREAARRLVRGFANPRSPEPVLREDARQLSRWLIGSWDSELDKVQTVVIESDGPLSSLPWPALVRSNGRYWSEEP